MSVCPAPAEGELIHVALSSPHVAETLCGELREKQSQVGTPFWALKEYGRGRADRICSSCRKLLGLVTIPSA